MRALSPLALTMFCACLFVFAPSCSFLQRVTTSAEQKNRLVDDTARQAQADIAGGEYKKALDRCSSAYEKYHYPEMSDNYAAAGEQIRQTADVAYLRRDFAEAGSIYNMLIESGITATDFASSLSFDDYYLNGRRKTCAKALLEAGLTTYRDGKIEDAISIWGKALVFDHDNKDIKSMIETATAQSKNLKIILLKPIK